MFIVKYRKIFYAISGLFFLVSIVSLYVWGLKPGIDFTGGALLEVGYTENVPTIVRVREILNPLNLGDYSVRETVGKTGESGFIIRMRTVSDREHVSILDVLTKQNATVTEKRFDSIGPVLGKEAVRKSFFSIALVLVAIVIFVTFAFRKVSEPVASWKYGLITIFALAHDVLVPAGAFAIFGHYLGFEVDTLFVTALLVILGFSVHDTIVVFDRVRENLRVSREKRDKKTFDVIVGESINQTFVRSINTSLTTLLALVVLYFVGSDATKHFSLALLIGITAGTYSSIFLGSPLLVTVEKWQQKRAD